MNDTTETLDIRPLTAKAIQRASGSALGTAHAGRSGLERLAAVISSAMASFSQAQPKIVLDRIGKGFDGADDGELHKRVAKARIVPADGTFAIGARVDGGFIHAACDMFFGGTGTEPAFAEDRPLSSTERRIAEKLLAMTASALAAALGTQERPAELTLELAEPDEGQDDAPSAGVEIRYLLNVWGYSGELILDIPARLLGQFTNEDQNHAAKSVKKADGSWVETLTGELRRSEVAVTAVLAEVATDVERLAQLQPGEVLELPASLDSAVRVVCDGEHLFDAKLGRQGDRMVLHVTGGT